MNQSRREGYRIRSESRIDRAGRDCEQKGWHEAVRACRLEERVRSHRVSGEPGGKERTRDDSNCAWHLPERQLDCAYVDEVEVASLHRPFVEGFPADGDRCPGAKVRGESDHACRTARGLSDGSAIGRAQGPSGRYGGAALG